MGIDVIHDERYWYPDDGGIVWVSGYQPVDRDGRYLARDAPELADRGVLVAPVAGAGRHHAEALQQEGAAPGEPLDLRRDPGNEHDPNAIAVHVGVGGPQIGWVPREIAETLAPAIDAGEAWSAVVLREHRASPRDPRTSLTMLLARGGPIELRVRAK